MPTLIHDGEIVVESTVINEYLDEIFPEPPLRPAEPYRRARMRLWTKREDSIHDAINTLTTAIVFRPDLLTKTPQERAARIGGIPDPSRRAKFHDLMEKGLEARTVYDALIRFARLFRDMEAALAAGPWLLGEAFTLADSGLISFFYRLEMMQLSGLWTETFPRVTDWFARCQARPSFEEAIRRHIPPTAFDRFRAVGVPAWPAVREKFATVLVEI